MGACTNNIKQLPEIKCGERKQNLKSSFTKPVSIHQLDMSGVSLIQFDDGSEKLGKVTGNEINVDGIIYVVNRSTN